MRCSNTIFNPAARAVTFCAVAVLCTAIMNFLLVPWSSLKRKFDDFAMYDGEIQTLLLGSSIDGDINPYMLSQQSVENTLIFCPNSGHTETSYYLLVNALESNDLKHVIVGWDILQNMQVPYYEYKNKDEFLRYLFPYIGRSKILCRYVLNEMMKQPYTYTFFEYATFPDNLTKIKSVFQSRAKRKANTPSAHFASAEDAKGYIVTPKQSTFEPIDVNRIEKDNFNYHKVVDLQYTTEISDIDLQYVKRIRDLCRERGVSLCFLYCPAPDVVIETLPDYYGMVEAARAMFSELAIEYIDTMDKKYFPHVTDNLNFRDCPGHMVESYYDIYTGQLCTYIKNVLGGLQ